MKIDTSGWAEFAIGNLFEKLNLRVLNSSFNKTLDVSETPSDEFSLPLVNAKHGNNGIMFYGREADFESAEMTIGIVQNGASATGDVYAHPYKTGVLWDAYLVKPRASIDSEGVLLFLATVIERAIKERFGYHDKCVWDKAKKLTVSLPIAPSGEPDWAYMDAYMSRVMREAGAGLDFLTSADSRTGLIDSSDWTRYSMAEIGFAKFHGQRLNKADRIEGTTPFLTAGRERNGLAMHVGNDRTTYHEPITVDMFGNCFYQPFNCAGDDNVYFFVNNEVSALSKMFIASSIDCEATRLYAYVDQFRQPQADGLTVLLPTADSGEPDWAYMDKYMSKVLANRSNALDDLKSVIGGEPS